MRSVHTTSQFETVLRFLPVLFFPVLLSCKTGYVVEQGTDFLHLMHQRVPIDSSAEQSGLTEKQQKKLRLVPDVRSYAKKQIGLRVGETYKTYVPLDRSAVSWNVTATQPYRIHPVVWTFPIVGSFPYIGFFDRSDAVEHRDRLIADGFDMYMRPVSAFSTLGWFEDPIYSPMLDFPEPVLIEIIFHELMHKQIFFSNHVSLSESIASELGRIATIDFLESTHGKDATIVKWTRNHHDDQTRVRRFFLNLRKRLKHMYNTERPNSWKRKRKRQMFMQAKRSFLGLLDQLKTEGWNQLLSVPWNNAFITSRAVYDQYSMRIRTLWRVAFNRNLSKTIRFLSSLDETRPVERINERIHTAQKNRDQAEDESISSR